MAEAKSIKEALVDCVRALEDGTLAPEQLREAVSRVPQEQQPGCQSLLYIQARSVAIDSPAVGYALFVNGQRQAEPGQRDPDVSTVDTSEEWPYKTVADALRDGWRIISFPTTAHMMDDKSVYGLGCEFILEKWTTE